MYKLNWYIYRKDETHDEPSLAFITNEWEKDKPNIVAFDTETTGLNIINDTPFLFIIAWKVPNQNIGKVFVIDWDIFSIAIILELMYNAKIIVGANTKYDLHMLRNGGCEFDFKRNKSTLTDIRIIRRITMNTDCNGQENNLALKQMATQFIDDKANTYEINVKNILNEISSNNQKVLRALLKPFKIKSKDINDDFKNGIDLYTIYNKEVVDVYKQWRKEYGEANYYKVYQLAPFSLLEYAAFDGIFTLELFLLFYPEIQIDKVQEVFERENKLIPIYYKQEYVGFQVDMNYLKESKQRVEKYLESINNRFHSLVGDDVEATQHKLLIDRLISLGAAESIFVKKDKKTNEDKLAFDKAIIRRLMKSDNQLLVDVAKLISRLRRATKWLSTYIDGVYMEVVDNGDNRLHPLSNQVGTVSGRISGNLQQQPKDALLDENGDELFHPRKLFIPSGNGYNAIILQDYDQMELRVQANMTVEYGCMDMKMCKIFLPIDCIHLTLGKFDINNTKHIDSWNEKDTNGNSVWIDINTLQPWTPIDPHGLLVESAFHIDNSHPNWKHLRSCAKIINFATNYGSGLNGLLENDNLEEYPQETITNLYNMYKENFVGVSKYQQLVESSIKLSGSVRNVYGRIYKVAHISNAYKCANYVIQGSCADLVKQCLIEITNYLETNNLKSRILYTIHDEIIWELYDGEQEHIKHIETILNKTASWCRIPLTCGTDIAIDNWANKKDINSIGGHNE